MLSIDWGYDSEKMHRFIQENSESSFNYSSRIEERCCTCLWGKYRKEIAEDIDAA